mmetsp:Transcript_37773/g.150628  ORF Transcript_37773/g.150628 Transcript_37773/m.150628 type:complete len:394 (+) Transcript_37773:311-1492(+)
MSIARQERSSYESGDGGTPSPMRSQPGMLGSTRKNGVHSPTFPSKWESPVTKRSIGLNAYRNEVNNTAVASATMYIFMVCTVLSMISSLLFGYSFLENIVPAMIVACSVSFSFALYFVGVLSNLRRKWSFGVTEHEAKLLAVDRKTDLVYKTPEPSPTSGKPPASGGSRRLSTTPLRLMKSPSETNEAVQRFISPDRYSGTAATPSPVGNRTISVASIGKFHHSRTSPLDRTDASKDPGAAMQIDYQWKGSPGAYNHSFRNVEALRRWLALKVLVPFAERESRISELLKVLSSSPNVSQASAAALVSERTSLDRYVTVPGYSRSLEYCRSRLRTLAEDTSVSKALWDSGSEWKGRSFEMFGLELPTDSELILTAFGAFFDERLPPNTAAKGSP